MASLKLKHIPNWKKCSNCSCILEHTKLDLHITTTSNCPPNNSSNDWSYGHVFEKKMYSFLSVFEPLNRNYPFYDDVVQVSLAAAQLCDFEIGMPVLLIAKNGNSVAKILWPIEDYILHSVFLTQQSLMELDLNELIIEAGGFHVLVQRMDCPILLAESVTVKLIGSINLNKCQMSEVSSLIKLNFRNKIITEGQFLLLNFYGQKVKFKVLIVYPVFSPTQEEDRLNEDFSQLKLDSERKYFKIYSKTGWIIESDVKKERCIEKFSLSKLGGIDDIIQQLRNIISSPLLLNSVKDERLYSGVMIHGVSGTGKSYLVNAIVNAFDFHVVRINSWEIFSKHFSEAENRLTTSFVEAIRKEPSFVVIDELDTFCPTKSGSDQEKRLFGVLIAMLDKLSQHRVFVLGVTRYLDSIDSALRRHGRFDYEIELSVPNRNARVDILRKIILQYNNTVPESVLVNLAKNAHGFVGADLALACTIANSHVLANAKTIDEAIICESDLISAFNYVKPSAMREIIVDIPNVQWTDIGGQEDLKIKLQQVIEWPLKFPEAFERLGLTPPRGVLLFGPPGCSKTMIAKAVATESKLNFISIKGANLFSKWVGESEKAVQEVFRKARNVSPSIIFFDEIDAIASEREADGNNGSNVQERVLSQLLTEMDGIQALNNVVVIAATNRPDRMDSALLRPGRFDRKLYVPLPDDDTRRAIFTLQFTKTPVDKDINIQYLVKCTYGYSGAEVVAVCREAAMKALQESLDSEFVAGSHFEYALKEVKPGTDAMLLKIYDQFLKH